MNNEVRQRKLFNLILERLDAWDLDLDSQVAIALANDIAEAINEKLPDPPKGSHYKTIEDLDKFQNLPIK